MLYLGIDFGTSTMFVTKYDFVRNNAVPVANLGQFGGSNIFENVIYIENDKNNIIGNTATTRGSADPLNFFKDIKRFIVTNDTFYTVKNLNNRRVKPIELATMIFSSIKNKVESNENRKIDGVVITVPYSYSENYRKLIVQSAENAGLTVIGLIEEPVSAAISFGMLNQTIQTNNHQENIVVFDFGGGTLDTTLINFKNNQTNVTLEVLNTDGVENLGGNDIDFLITEEFRKKLNVNWQDFSNENERAKFKLTLYTLARQTKELLSTDDEYEIFEVFVVNGKEKTLDFTFNRNDLEKLLRVHNVLGRIQNSLEQLFYSDNNLTIEPKDIDRVILAGGSSAIPAIKKLLHKFFGKEPESRPNLNELVGHGAGIVAGMTKGGNVTFKVIKKTSKSIGIAQGTSFKPILSKNHDYGIESSKQDYYFANNQNNTNLTIYIYEGDSSQIDNCTKIGKVIFNTQNLTNNRVRISISRESLQNQIEVKFYNEQDLLIQTAEMTSVIDN